MDHNTKSAASMLDEPGAEELDTFEERLRLVWRRDGIEMDDLDDTARLVRLLIEQQGPESPAAAALLRETGIRRQWNEVFARRRAAVVAEWLLPFLRSPLLDVLAGDFTLTRQLHAHGIDVIATERMNSYQVDWSAQPFPVIDHVELGAPLTDDTNTALLCTVLHHEPDPLKLLNELDRLSHSRWVVVENCIDAENTEGFHMLVDRFFNGCLNQFDVSCVPEHRTQAQWSKLLADHGRVRTVQTYPDVPGIPFPYDIFVVDRPGGDQCR